LYTAENYSAAKLCLDKLRDISKEFYLINFWAKRRTIENVDHWVLQAAEIKGNREALEQAV